MFYINMKLFSDFPTSVFYKIFNFFNFCLKCLYDSNLFYNFAQNQNEIHLDSLIIMSTTSEEYKDEKLLVAALRLDSHEAFVRIFRQYYPNLVSFAGQFIPDKLTCEDIVQNIFLSLWQERKDLHIRSSLRSYLTVLVQNMCLNQIRHNKVKARYESEIHEAILSLSPEEHMFFSELNMAFDSTLSQMDPTLRETLLLSRDEKLKYPEIAERLNISVRTVEDRISRAMKLLRNNLRDFKYFIPLFILSFKDLL